MGDFADQARKTEAFLTGKRRLLVTTHTGPDGDGLGSALAMSRGLVQLGFLADIVVADSIPERYRFLDPTAQIERFELKRHDADAYSGAIVVDANELQRCGALGAWIASTALPCFFVDHHPAPPDLVAQHVIEKEASSAGQVVYQLLTALGVTVDQEMGRAILAAILYDTNSFRHSRNDVMPFLIASELVGLGVDAMEISARLFSRKSLGKMRIAERLLARMALAYDGRVAWSYVDAAEMDALMVTDDDLRELVNWLVDIDGVEISFLIRADTSGLLKLSFRSSGDVPINRVAEAFGGGGHGHAAGARVNGGSVEVVSSQILTMVGALLSA